MTEPTGAPDCQHEIVRRTIGGFPGHRHSHPTGPQFCVRCDKTLDELLAAAFAEGQAQTNDRLTRARTLLDRARLSLEPECGHTAEALCGENCDLRRQIHEFLWPSSPEGLAAPPHREGDK